MRIESLLRDNAWRAPDKAAIIHLDEPITYRQLHHRARRLAWGLSRLGLRADDRVVLYLGNHLEFAELLYASFYVGAVVVPVNTKLTFHELRHIVGDSSPAFIVVHRDHSDGVVDLATQAGARAIVIGGPIDGAVTLDELAASGSDEDFERPWNPSADDALILYTSGTTGRPKGAITTHRNLITQSYFLNAVNWGFKASDIALATTPLAHRFAFSRLTSAICFGATLILPQRFDAAATVDAIERHKVTILGAVPTVCRLLLPEIRKDPRRLSSLRTILTTGEAFPVSLKQDIRQLLPEVGLLSFFGQTEAGGVTTLNPDEQISHAASVGRPMPGIEVKLVDDAGRQVATDEIGELLVRSGPPGSWTTMRGYFGNPAATKETIADGWIKTGDLARQDADGYLYIVDRKKDMIVSGGYNIYSKEVEGALHTDPAIADAAVVGVPDPIYGEAVFAFVEPKPGHAVDPDAIIGHCRELLAGYKKPRYVSVRDHLPRNAQGKILKTLLRAEAIASLERAAHPDAPAAADRVRDGATSHSEAARP